MAPREFKERVSERGLDLRLSLSIGGSGTGTVDLNPVQKDGTGTHVAKQRNSEVVNGNIADIAAGVNGIGFVLEKSVSIGTGKSSPVLSDMDSKYFIGGSSTNINSSSSSSSSSTTTTSATENTGIVNNTNNGIIFPKMPHMPFVTVKGSSVTGFLYLVTSTAKVFIVCTCHGSFFSPAGFVQHAGCTDVTNPLRLIVVKPY